MLTQHGNKANLFWVSVTDRQTRAASEIVMIVYWLNGHSWEYVNISGGGSSSNSIHITFMRIVLIPLARSKGHYGDQKQLMWTNASARSKFYK